MPWGYDEWLTDRGARRGWMRAVALVGLVEQILRTPALAREGLACLLDEVLGDAAPTAANIDDDVARGAAWVRAALDAARAEGVPFQALALVLPDGAPYRFSIALVDGPVRDVDWRGSISWRSSDDFDPRALDALLMSLGDLPADVREHADHAVPLGYAAFLLRDVLRAGEISKAKPVREATVTYDGGDCVDVPIP